MSWGVENQKRREGVMELMEISSRIMKNNPNHVNEVQKSATGCWMEQSTACNAVISVIYPLIAQSGKSRNGRNI